MYRPAGRLGVLCNAPPDSTPLRTQCLVATCHFPRFVFISRSRTLAKSAASLVRIVDQFTRMNADNGRARHSGGHDVDANVAVVGATGAVGEIMRQVLEERNFPVRTIKFLASERSAGKTITFQGKRIPSSRSVPRRLPAWTSCCPARRLGQPGVQPDGGQAGAIVVDNSSAWRMDPDVPLVVPEVNADALRTSPRASSPTRTARPSRWSSPSSRCTTWPGSSASSSPPTRHRPARGPRACDELDARWPPWAGATGAGADDAHTAQLAGNVLPHDWKAGRRRATPRKNGRWSARRGRSWATTRIQVSPTTARVPVRIGHSEAINLEFHGRSPSSRPGDVLRKAPGIILLDDSPRAKCRCRWRPKAATRSSSAASAGPDRAARPEPLGRRRQPPQGRGNERRADRRGAGPAAG